MPINVYTGLMRSGKSYEVVSEVIVPAIRSGRRVVTNVDGISEEKIHAYLKAKHPKDEHDKYGKILHVANGDVFGENFFPYYDDQKEAHTDTIVQPGDLVAIDEAWRFWGDKMKIHKNHQSFILEHGHFTHPETKVACDMVLMIQDMGTLNKFIKNVVAFSFRTTKKVSLGLSKVYSLNMWEGKSMTKANHIGQWTRTYKTEIFPLYSSFKGGAEGVMVNADKRQNILRNWKVWMPFVVALTVIAFAVPTIFKFFRPDGAPVVAANASKAPAGAPVSKEVPPQQAQAVWPAKIAYSDEWRICGGFYADGKSWVVVCDTTGAVRVESPSMFHNAGLAQIGTIDGEKVASWSGGPHTRPVSGSAPAISARSAFGEVRK